VDAAASSTKRVKVEAQPADADNTGSEAEDEDFREMSRNAAKGAPPGWMRTIDDGEPKDYFYPGDGTRVCTLSEGPHAFVLRMPAI